jgi:oxygen-independent coproporphyrinogen-3 oxidase
MHGLPGQTVAMALADLTAAIELEPSHLSWYQLTLEPNTVFHARPPADLPDEDTEAEICDAGQRLLSEHGYLRYEVSAYARGEMRCRHNENYWRFGDYLAAGAGAHGKITVADGPVRYRKPANPLSFMTRVESGQDVTEEPVAAPDRLFEFLLMATRLDDGFDLDLFQATTRLPAATLEEAMRSPVERGFIEALPGGHYRPTPLGQRFLNELQASFLP